MREQIFTLLAVSLFCLSINSLQIHTNIADVIVGGFSRPNLIQDENAITGDLK